MFSPFGPLFNALLFGSEQSPIPLAGLHTWLRPGYGLTDNGSGGLLIWTSQDPTNRTFTAGTNKPSIITGDSDFNGQTSIDNNGNSQLTSDDPASEWNFMADGSGCMIFVAWNRTSNISNARLLGNYDTNDSHCDLTFSGGTTQPRLIIRNGTTDIIDIVSTSTTSNATTYLTGVRVESGASPEGEVEVNGDDDTAAAGGAFASSVPNTLHIFDAATGALKVDAKIAEVIIYSVRNNATYAAVKSYMAALHGASF